MFSLLNIASLYYFAVGLVCVCWLKNMWRYVGKERVCMDTMLLFYILNEKWPLKIFVYFYKIYYSTFTVLVLVPRGLVVRVSDY